MGKRACYSGADSPNVLESCKQLCSAAFGASLPQSFRDARGAALQRLSVDAAPPTGIVGRKPGSSSSIRPETQKGPVRSGAHRLGAHSSIPIAFLRALKIEEQRGPPSTIGTAAKSTKQSPTFDTRERFGDRTLSPGRAIASGDVQVGAECVADDVACGGVVGFRAGFECGSEFWFEPDGKDVCCGCTERRSAGASFELRDVVAGFCFVGHGLDFFVGDDSAVVGDGFHWWSSVSWSRARKAGRALMA